jgi:hypothetical protein
MSNPTPLPISPADWWELQARSKDVALAEAGVAIARGALVEAQRRILMAHGADPALDYELVKADG